MLTKKGYEEEVLNELKGLSKEKIQKIITFIHFVKHEDTLQKIDPDQVYFWTKEWQEGEKRADEDIKEGRLLGPFTAVSEFKEAIKGEK